MLSIIHPPEKLYFHLSSSISSEKTPELLQALLCFFLRLNIQVSSCPQAGYLLSEESSSGHFLKMWAREKRRTAIPNAFFFNIPGHSATPGVIFNTGNWSLNTQDREVLKATCVLSVNPLDAKL